MILALDTSGGELLACLLAEDLGVTGGVCVPGRRHQEAILAAVEEVLGGRQEVARLSAIAVVRGPGSQTGLRVGLAAAEGLAFASRLSLWPLSSLSVAAHRATPDGNVLAAVSAGRSNVYVQLFRARGPERFPAGARILSSAAEVRARLTDPALRLAAEPSLLEAYGETIPSRVNGGVEALAAAAREAISKGVAVSYHELRGDYGE